MLYPPLNWRSEKESANDAYEKGDKQMDTSSPTLSSSEIAFQAQSKPAALGKTGVKTCTIDKTLQIQCVSPDGAPAIRRAMFTRIAALGAIQVANLLLGLGDGNVRIDVTPEQIRAYLSQPSTVPNAFHALDFNQDGKVSASEIFHLTTDAVQVANPLSNFLSMVAREMEIGAGGEKILSFAGHFTPPTRFGPAMRQTRGSG